MRKTFVPALLLLGAAATAGAAELRVEMNAVDARGVGAPLGQVTIAEKDAGVSFIPELKGLPPGPHGFHVHEFANCGAKAKDGMVSAAEMAGGHWDPDKHQRHGGPDGRGHRGDLPPLVVSPDGHARTAVDVKGVKLSALKGKSLVIHAGGDNHSDQPKPNGGGGERIACGVIQAGVR